MARADFYILNGPQTASRFSCTVAGKAWRQGHRVYILAVDDDQAAVLDDLLWSYQDTSFLPHARIDDQEPETPIVIGWPGKAGPAADVLINLSEDIPEDREAYPRIVEIVPEDPQRRDQGRDRYRRYRELGYELHNHTIEREA